MAPALEAPQVSIPQGAVRMKSIQQQLPCSVRRISAAVALAFSAGIPLAAHAEAPKVTWQGPLSGAVLSGTISGSGCSVNATSSVGVGGVSFWIDDYQIQNDYSAP